jgi:D-alanine-D-alanine ligase
VSSVAVVFGGPSPESDISVLTGLQAARTLAGVGVEVEAIYWAKSAEWHAVDPGLEAIDFVEGVPRRARHLQFVAAPGGGFLPEGGLGRRRPLPIEVVVNCCHGGPGEDGTLQAAFDLAGLAYTGPGVVGSLLGMDKLAFGALVASAGFPGLPRLLLEAETVPSFDPPFIVKPRFGGSSIGVEVVADLTAAVALAHTSPFMVEGAVIEPFLEGAVDLEIGVRTWPELQLSAVRAPERGEGGAIYSYDQKYLAWSGQGGPAAAGSGPGEAIEQEVRNVAIAVAGLLGLRSVARIDFLHRGDGVWLNEVNTIPGSLAHYLWVDPPVSREQLLLDMVEEARRRPPRRFVTSGADGSALRSAASIAQKLG